MDDQSDRQVRIYRYSYHHDGRALIDIESMLGGIGVFWHNYVAQWLHDNDMVENGYPIRKWVEASQVGDQITHSHALITFKTSSDAVAFKLRWSERLEW